jgi:hypothetical protein
VHRKARGWQGGRERRVRQGDSSCEGWKIIRCKKGEDLEHGEKKAGILVCCFRCTVMVRTSIVLIGIERALLYRPSRRCRLMSAVDGAGAIGVMLEDRC